MQGKYGGLGPGGHDGGWPDQGRLANRERTGRARRHLVGDIITQIDGEAVQGSIGSNDRQDARRGEDLR